MSVHVVGGCISSVLPESNLFEYSLGNSVCYKYLERQVFPEQAASDADLTASSGYFFGHILAKKKKKLLIFGIFFFSVLQDLVFTRSEKLVMSAWLLLILA